MSWDIFLFNSKEKIKLIEELTDDMMEPTDFCVVFENYFGNIIRDENHREIKGPDYSICYFQDKTQVKHTIVNLYGENGLFELIELAKKHSWIIFDTGMGGIINLENPSENGYQNFQTYLLQIKQSKI